MGGLHTRVTVGRAVETLVGMLVEVRVGLAVGRGDIGDFDTGLADGIVVGLAVAGAAVTG